MIKNANNLFLALLAGIIITGISAAQMGWVSLSPCNYSVSNLEVLTKISDRTNCAGMEYGYPRRFIVSKPTVDISLSNPSEISTFQIGSTAVIELKWPDLFIDLIVWSSLSFLLITVFKQKLSKNTSKKAKK